MDEASIPVKPDKSEFDISFAYSTTKGGNIIQGKGKPYKLMYIEQIAILLRLLFFVLARNWWVVLKKPAHCVLCAALDAIWTSRTSTSFHAPSPSAWLCG